MSLSRSWVLRILLAVSAVGLLALRPGLLRGALRSYLSDRASIGRRSTRCTARRRDPRWRHGDPPAAPRLRARGGSGLPGSRGTHERRAAAAVPGRVATCPVRSFRPGPTRIRSADGRCSTRRRSATPTPNRSCRRRCSPPTGRPETRSTPTPTPAGPGSRSSRDPERRHPRRRDPADPSSTTRSRGCARSRSSSASRSSPRWRPSRCGPCARGCARWHGWRRPRARSPPATCPTGSRTPTPAPRSAASVSPSTRCSPGSNMPSPSSGPARSGCGGSSRTPRTSCARR